MTSDHSATQSPKGDWHDQQRELDRQAVRDWQPPEATTAKEWVNIGTGVLAGAGAMLVLPIVLVLIGLGLFNVLPWVAGGISGGMP